MVVAYKAGDSRLSSGEGELEVPGERGRVSPGDAEGVRGRESDGFDLSESASTAQTILFTAARMRE